MKSDAPLKTTYADVLPPLTTEERKGLEDSIKAEGVHTPILVDEGGEIIDGKHRYLIDPGAPRKLIAGLATPAQKTAAAIRLNASRRNMTPEQREELAKKQREVALELREEKDANGAPRHSQAQIGVMLGVSQPTVSDWLNETVISPDKGLSRSKRTRKRSARTKIWPEQRAAILKAARNLPHAQIAADFGITAQRVGQIVKAEQKVRAARERAAADARAAEDGSREGLVVVGDFREKGAAIADGSVDLIFTDPPYDRKSVPLYGDLAEFAARVLAPGGSLIAFAGHYAIPDVLELMRGHLTFWWCNALVHTHGNRTFPGKFVHVGWKPLLWFVKGKARATRKVVRDCILAGDGGPAYDRTNKAVYHEWGQGEREAAYYVENLSRRKSLVVDPFLGGGTTGACAVRLGRRFVGFELDPRVARRAAGRVAKARPR